MARLKELADLGFVIAFRFYGRYPETGRSYYKPPCDTVRAAALDMSSLESDNNAAKRSPPRRPAGLVTLVHSFSAPNLSEWISNGTDDISGTSLSGVLPSPMAQDVGAH